MIDSYYGLLGQGCPVFLGDKRPQPILWAGLRAARVKIAINCVSNPLNYFITYIAVAQQPNSSLGLFIFYVSRHTCLVEPSRRVIGLAQRPLSTQHTTNTRDEYPYL